MKIIKFCLVTAVLLGGFSTALATEEYAEKTGKSCEHCHLDASGGGELTKAGKEYNAQLMEDIEPRGTEAKSERTKSPAYYIRLAAGFLHIFMAFFWFGTILYVHIILKPAYAAHGLPKGEVKLGLIAMVIMAITGIILMVNRVPAWSFLLETRFGLLLLIKIILFLSMVSLAMIAVFLIGPKMKERIGQHRAGAVDKFTEDDLRGYTGDSESPVYFAYRGKVYDASKSKSWSEGIHFGRHKAGEDLTLMLKQAPHGEEKIFALPVAGLLTNEKKKGKTNHYKRVFFLIAYTELVFVILIILILTLWKWL
jgi:predicted heme/steroid binding protein